MASGTVKSIKYLTSCAFSVLTAALIPLAVPSVAAQEREIQIAQAGRSFAINIPAKPLPQAIADLSAATGLQVLYTQDQPFGRNSQPVSGTYTAEQALGIMLQGSGLGYRFTSANAVTLVAQGNTTGGTTVLQPLTVTGEKIDRSLAETATSVAIFDETALQQRPGLSSANALIDRVPNVTTSGTNNSQAPTIRGVDGTGPTQGSYAFVAGIRPRLNLLIDGRPASFNELVYGDLSLWDTEQVEVLRGPQSTMQGRNAIAGAIVVKTKDPTWDWEGGARLLAGNYDTRQGAAYVSGPIIEDQLAFRLAFDRQVGETFVRGTVPFPADRLDDPDKRESTALRGKLLIEPRKLDGFSTLLTFNYNKTVQPQAEMVTWPEAGLQNGYPTGTAVFQPKSLSGIADTSWILSDRFTLENTASYTDLSVRRFAPNAFGYAEIDGYELLEEPRLRFAGMGDRLEGLVGLHAFHASQDELLVFGGDNFYKDMTTTYAAFGEATYSILSDVDVTLGGRLERENRRRQSLGGGLTPVDFDETYEVFLPKAGVAWHVQPTWTLGATVARGYNGGGAGVTFGSGLSYRFSPEYVWNYEAYTRHELLGGRLSITGNVFYADYENMQLPYNPTGGQDAVVLNAPKSHTLGSEIGARFLAAPGLTLFGNIGLLKTEIDRFDAYTGNDLPMSPALTADIGFAYQFGDGFDVSADARYSEAYYSDIDNRPRAKVDPYWVANAQAGYSFSSVRVFGFVNNLFDNRDETQIFLSASEGDTANILRPRTVGVGVDVTF